MQGNCNRLPGNKCVLLSPAVHTLTCTICTRYTITRGSSSPYSKCHIEQVIQVIQEGMTLRC